MRTSTSCRYSWKHHSANASARASCPPPVLDVKTRMRSFDMRQAGRAAVTTNVVVAAPSHIKITRLDASFELQRAEPRQERRHNRLKKTSGAHRAASPLQQGSVQRRGG